MSLQDVARSVDKFTICLRVYLTGLARLQVHMSYAISDDRTNDLMSCKFFYNLNLNWIYSKL